MTKFKLGDELTIKLPAGQEVVCRVTGVGIDGGITVGEAPSIEERKALTVAKVRHALESRNLNCWTRTVMTSSLGEDIDFYTDTGKLMISVRITPKKEIKHANFMFDMTEVDSNDRKKIIEMMKEIDEALDDEWQ